MAIPLPNLDDKTFAQLMEEAKAIIPRYSRDWTNFNPSDPGITLLELFAWINEMIIYRQNTITKETKWELLKLLMPAPKTAFVELAVPYVAPVGEESEGVKDENVAFSDEYKLTTKVSRDGVDVELRFLFPRSNRRILPNGEEFNFVRFYNVAEHPFAYDKVENPRGEFCLDKRACPFESKNQTIPLFTIDDKVHKPLLYHPDMKREHHFYSLLKPVLHVKSPSEDKPVEWRFVEFLHEHTNKNVFSFDYHRRAIIFGDGITGNIPPANATFTMENLFLSDGSLARVKQYADWGMKLIGSEANPMPLPVNNLGKAQCGDDWYMSENGDFLDEETLDHELLNAAIRKSLEFHRPPYFRAVTQEDYIGLAKDAFKTSLLAPEGKKYLVEGVQQAWTVENYKISLPALESDSGVSYAGSDANNSPQSDDGENLRNHLSVLIMNESLYDTFKQIKVLAPDQKLNREAIADLHKEMTESVFSHLDRRRLITTMLHVGLPREKYFAMEVSVRILSNKMKSLGDVEALILDALEKYFNPMYGGVDRKGRPVGQSLYKSEIYTLLEKLAFIDVVDELVLYKEKDNSRAYSENAGMVSPIPVCTFLPQSGEATLNAGNTVAEAVAISMETAEAVPLQRDELLVFLTESVKVSITF